MTAEATVMNKHGIALAADSAVTFSGPNGGKIFTSANKIFALSKYASVAVMIYGNAELLGVPWETTIKLYREQLGDKRFDTLQDYAVDFVTFAESNAQLFPAEVQTDYARALAGVIYEYVVTGLRHQLKRDFGEDDEITEDQVETVLHEQVDSMLGHWLDQPPLAFTSDEHSGRVRDLYGGAFPDLIAEVFEELPMSAEDRVRLMDLAEFVLTREPPVELDHVTGVVFAGYGEIEIFPSFLELKVDGVAADELIAWHGRSAGIERQNDAYVGAFAQGEMVSRFMEGVDPDYQDLLDGTLSQVVAGYTETILDRVGMGDDEDLIAELAEARAKMLEEYQTDLHAHRTENYAQAVLQVVQGLPLGELAHMAESLVNLTSFKRRVSMEAETVSGPIDAVVISKGDGLIWIKRKHYFEPDRNPHFFANYYRGGPSTDGD